MKKILVISLVCVISQSCGLFKGSKCNDCPTWGALEVSEAKVRV